MSFHLGSRANGDPSLAGSNSDSSDVPAAGDHSLADSITVSSDTPATGDHSLSTVSLNSDSAAIQVSNGFITIDTTASDGDGAALLKQLQAIGLQNGNAFGAVASGLLPVADMSALAGVANLGFVQEAVSRTGAAQIPPQFSNGVRANVARSGYGVDGTGVTVGIISDSFNESNDTVPGSTTRDDTAYDIANGYLPQNTRVLNDSPTGGGMTDEGRAMAQIVHQVAPGASILFDTGEGGQATFAQHILDLAAAGAKVIVDDLSYFAEPDYQDGVIAQAIKTVEAQGVTYLSSAGNDGSAGYEGAFKAGQTFTYNGTTYTADQFGAAAGTAGDLLPINLGPLDPGQSETIYYELQWDQPAASASPGHGATSNLDLFYTDANGNVINGLVSTANNIGGDPSEVVSVTLRNNTATTQTYSRYLEVGLASGSAAPSDLRIIASGDGYPVSIGTEASNTNIGTLAGHHGQEGSSAVGAVYYENSPAYGTTPPVNEGYSSAGVDNVDYADDGTPQTRQVNTVTFSGIDGGDTSFFGDDSDSDGLPNFFGTSAAAPSAAAVAALMLQKHPSLTSAQIKQALAQSAILTSSGTLIGGTGLIQADVAVNSVVPDAAPTATIPQTYSTAPDQTLSLKNTGIMVADTDGGTTIETATLTVGEGVLTATTGTSGATVTGSGTGTIVVTGTVAQIDAFLDTDATSTLGYSDAAATSSRTVALTLGINDNASPLMGGPKTGSASSTITVVSPNQPSPTISGLVNSTTNLQDAMQPFASATVTDPTSGATDSLSIALSGAAGTLAGAGLTANADGTYTLTFASPQTLTQELDALTFTPAIANSGPLEATTFALTVTSSSGASAMGSKTYVVDSTPNQGQFGTTTTSASSVQGEVYALYEGLLARAPDQLGGEKAVADLKGNPPLDQLTQSLLVSQEGASWFTPGSGDGDFVNQLYERVLGRVETTDEQGYWDRQLAAGASRAAVADDFVFSPEHLNDIQPALNAGVFIADNATSESARLYYGLLDRSPDQTGLQNQAAAVNGGTSLDALAQGFLNSPEYAADNPMPLSNQAFVNALFADALGRTPDQGGYWTQQLDSGAQTRAQVTVGIVESAEAQQHLAGRIENGYHLA